MEFKIPLCGAYTSRISTSQSLDTSSGYVGIGIVGLMVVGASSSATNKDARFVNCFTITTTNPITGKKRVKTVKRPGWGTATTPAAGSIGNQILVWTGESPGTKVVSAFGGTNSTIYVDTTSKGAITGLATGLTETKVGSNVATVVISSSDNTAWYYDTATGSATKVTDADFPGNNGYTLAGTFSHLDGYACIMTTDGKLWASDLNSVTAWTATSYDSANSYPDAGIGCIRHGNFIMCFGTQSIQFFYNATLTPFPLKKADAKTIKIGAINADSISQIAETVFWVGSTAEGGLSVFKFDGSVSRISTPEIDTNMILAGTSNISITTLRYYGRSFVRVKAASVSYTYCIEENEWFEESTATPIATKISSTSIGSTMVNYAVSNVSTSGKVFVINHSALVFTDNGAAYTARIQLDSMDLDTVKMKTWEDIELVGDRETASSPITLSYSDDDYQTYTTWGTLNLSDQRVHATRLGASRKRAWVLTSSAATPMGIEWLYGHASIGPS